MILYSVASEYSVFPYSSPQNSVKSVRDGYIEYRKIEGKNTAVELFSTNPFDYISSQYFNPNNSFRRKL